MSSVINNVSPPPTPLVCNLQDHLHLGALRSCALISWATSPAPCRQKYSVLFISVNINPSTMPSVQPPELSAIYCFISMITIFLWEKIHWCCLLFETHMCKAYPFPMCILRLTNRKWPGKLPHVPFSTLIRNKCWEARFHLGRQDFKPLTSRVFSPPQSRVRKYNQESKSIFEVWHW